MCNFPEIIIFYGSRLPEDYVVILINLMSFIDYVVHLFPF